MQILEFDIKFKDEMKKYSILGDAVLDLIEVERFVKKGLNNSEINRQKKWRVCNKTLARYYDKLLLNHILPCNKFKSYRSNHYKGDVIEALIGFVYKNYSYEIAKEFYFRLKKL